MRPTYRWTQHPGGCVLLPYYIIVTCLDTGRKHWRNWFLLILWQELSPSGPVAGLQTGRRPEQTAGNRMIKMFRATTEGI